MTDTELRRITAPFTTMQVAQLNIFQRSGVMHPFTCPEHSNRPLLAQVDGWECTDPDCRYTQDWAHAFMADPATVNGWALPTPEPSPEARRQYIEAACEVMHDAYEKAATGAGWETNPASRKPWSGVPEANKVTMRAAVGALIEWMDSHG